MNGEGNELEMRTGHGLGVLLGMNAWVTGQSEGRHTDGRVDGVYHCCTGFVQSWEAPADSNQVPGLHTDSDLGADGERVKQK